MIYNFNPVLGAFASNYRKKSKILHFICNYCISYIQYTLHRYV